MCRCAERRDAISRSGEALRRGDVGQMANEAAFVVATSAGDLRQAAVARIAAAKARLRR